MTRRGVYVAHAVERLNVLQIRPRPWMWYRHGLDTTETWSENVRFLPMMTLRPYRDCRVIGDGQCSDEMVNFNGSPKLQLWIIWLKILQIWWQPHQVCRLVVVKYMGRVPFILYWLARKYQYLDYERMIHDGLKYSKGFVRSGTELLELHQTRPDTYLQNRFRTRGYQSYLSVFPCQYQLWHKRP